MPFVFPEILIPLIIAFLLGLLFGWLFWGWRRTKISYTEWETMRQKAGRASSVETEAELAELRADRDRLQAAADSHVCEISAGDADNAALGTGVLGLAGAGAAVAGSADTDADVSAGKADDAADIAASDDNAPASGTDADKSNTDTAATDTDADADAAAADADTLVSDTSGDNVDPSTLSDADRPVAGERHPYGEGSHAPFSDDPKIQPEGYEIKGNADSMLYHRTDSRVYAATVAEVWFDTPQRAEDNGFALAKSHPKDSVIADADRPVAGERHPYGEGSHGPFSDDPKIQPEGYEIKGNADSMLYHRTDSRSYKATIPEVWFDTPERAEAAGFGLANSHPKD